MGRQFLGEKDALFAGKTTCFTLRQIIPLRNTSRARAHIRLPKHRAPMHPVHPNGLLTRMGP